MKAHDHREAPNLALRIAITIAVIALAYLLQALPLGQAVENRLYDWRIGLAAAGTSPSPEIVLIAIDEDSLAELSPAVGRWPWPRSVLATVLEYCSGAQTIVLDILFPEGDWQYQGSMDDDVFVEVMERQSNVVNAIHMNAQLTRETNFDRVSRFALSRTVFPSLKNNERAELLMPFEKLLDVSAGVGHVNPVFDSDGVARSYALVLEVQGRVLPSLALAGVMHFQGLDKDALAWQEPGMFMAGPNRVPAQPNGELYYRPSREKFTQVPIAEVLRSWRDERESESPVLSRSFFENKLVIIGSLAVGMYEDFKATPLSAETAGVEIIATVMNNLLQDQGIVIPPPALLPVLMVVLALLPALLRLTGPRSMLAGGLIIGLLFILGAAAAVRMWSIMVPMTGPFLALAMNSASLGGIMWQRERSRRKELEVLDRAKQEFTDMLVHDLKTTMAPLMISVQYGEKHRDEGFMKDEFPHIVEDVCQRLLTKVNALLDIRRMQDGRMRLSKGKVGVSAWLNQLRQQYKWPMARAERTMEVQCAVPENREVEIDADIMQRVMENLLWNALKYGMTATPIELGAESDGNKRIVFTVSNAGPVIPEEQLPTLFTPFLASGKTGNDFRTPSTGLGLTFCKLAVEAHGGRLEVQSPRPGKEDGVLVRLVLPQATP